MIITPAVLTNDPREALRYLQLELIQELGVHWDVLDDSLFSGKTFFDPELFIAQKELGAIELHLMVSDPIRVAIEWRNVLALKKVIVHSEIGPGLGEVLERMAVMKLQTAVAISPEILPEAVLQWQDKFEEIVIMGVQPGAMGKEFLGERVISKIKRAKALFPKHRIAVDGGVSDQNAAQLKEAGADRLITASYLWKNPSPREALRELQRLV